MAERRVHELRQKSKKEQGGLGIEEVDQDALSENVEEPSVAIGGLHQLRIVAAERLNAEVDQVCGAQILHQLECQSGRSEQRGESERGANDVEERSYDDAQDGDESSGSSVADAAADDVSHCRAGDHEKDSSAGYEQQQGRVAGGHK